MAQHFLLSTAARTLSLSVVARMSDEEARVAFQAIRWADNGGQPYCPKCGCLKVYGFKTRPVWKCSACRHQFSVTSGTIFDNRKLPVRDYLLAIAIFVNGAKGHSALQLSRDLNCQYKTAFVLAHKLREAMGATLDDGTELKGEVEVDGLYAGGHRKPANEVANRVDRRLAEEQTGKRQVVVVIRERNGRALPFVFRKESDAIPTIRAKVASGTILFADESRQWDALHASYDTRRINHSEAYSKDGASTNWAESYFARLRRAEIGTHHRISGAYIGAYANEMAWRENMRRTANGSQWRKVMGAAMAHPVSGKWAGYWQRSA
ncbi:DDE transposase [Hypericibacter adhaerens]|uniref:DDE transposase n=1 Tax=Hypericibacter adhaerens TaxID=2602016 RepID=A0A5J6N6D1_9PROT|nr:IS1595 family transposase [Hypericibacter adhaerens]QEX25054.1 DDE transposase [Hypericibacter adhaerens]